MVSEKDKPHFHPDTPASVILAFVKRLAAGETAEEIRALERKKDRSPVVLGGYAVGPPLRPVPDLDEEVDDDAAE